MTRSNSWRAVWACVTLVSFGCRGPGPAVTPDHAAVPVSTDGSTVTERWIPTGDPATSVLLLRQSMPFEMRVDRENRCLLEVVNRTKETLPGVSIATLSLSNLAIAGSEPEPTLRQGGRPIWMLGDLLPGEARTITLQVKPVDSGPVSTAFSASLANVLEGAAEAIEPRLELVKTATAQACGSCTDLEFTYAVRNAGTGTIRGVTITDRLPDGLVTATGGREIAIEAGDLGPRMGRTFTVAVRAERAGTFASDANATARDGLSARSVAVTTRVEQPELAIAGAPTPGAGPTSEVTYRFEVSNPGACTVNGVEVRVDLPDGVRVLAASGDGSLEGSSVRWILDAVRAGESIERTVRVRIEAARIRPIRAAVHARCVAEVATEAAIELVAAPDSP